LRIYGFVFGVVSGKTGYYHHGQTGITFFDCFKQVNSVHFGHLEVGYDHIELLVFQAL
jgi:hypothetical protein